MINIFLNIKVKKKMAGKILTGPRGGKYRLVRGRKVYLKRSTAKKRATSKKSRRQTRKNVSYSYAYTVPLDEVVSNARRRARGTGKRVYANTARNRQLNRVGMVY